MMAMMVIMMAVVVAFFIIGLVFVVGIMRRTNEKQKYKNSQLHAGRRKNAELMDDPFISEDEIDDVKHFTVGADGELVEVIEDDFDAEYNHLDESERRSGY